jgi:putative ABC transport system permease protein
MQVKYGNQNSNCSIVGTTADYVEVKNYTVPYGRMFTAGDDEARQRYAVLGPRYRACSAATRAR